MTMGVIYHTAADADFVNAEALSTRVKIRLNLVEYTVSLPRGKQAIKLRR